MKQKTIFLLGSSMNSLLYNPQRAWSHVPQTQRPTGLCLVLYTFKKTPSPPPSTKRIYCFLSLEKVDALLLFWSVAHMFYAFPNDELYQENRWPIQTLAPRCLVGSLNKLTFDDVIGKVSWPSFHFKILSWDTSKAPQVSPEKNASG